ncbi:MULTISPECIES: hypothetical protein [Bacillus cereus group]|uniref:hypothetical protein n=1 Tax=Bacillus cereus group TaxID=86661 RepID=UPI000BEC4583|nr:MULTISPECIES: hypothetical protein [Bacillus cereus group]PEF50487.1 hypothetical protein CON56_21200 [Bacillus thuringiensis]PFO91818.1 hypothetical protein COJ97_27320 [Bacillus cereus]
MKKRSRAAKIGLLGTAFTLSIGLAACGNNGEKKVDQKDMKNMDQKDMDKMDHGSMKKEEKK